MCCLRGPSACVPEQGMGVPRGRASWQGLAHAPWKLQSFAGSEQAGGRKSPGKLFQPFLLAAGAQQGEQHRADRSLPERVPLTECSELTCRAIAHLGCHAAEPSRRAARVLA